MSATAMERGPRRRRVATAVGEVGELRSEVGDCPPGTVTGAGLFVLKAGSWQAQLLRWEPHGWTIGRWG